MGLRVPPRIKMSKPPPKPKLAVSLLVSTVFLVVTLAFSTSFSYSKEEGYKFRVNPERISPWWAAAIFLSVGAAFGIDVEKSAIYELIEKVHPFNKLNSPNDQDSDNEA